MTGVARSARQIDPGCGHGDGTFGDTLSKLSKLAVFHQLVASDEIHCIISSESLNQQSNTEYLARGYN
jgi:hypothetical protein